MDPKDVEDKKQTRRLRRPFGVAAIDITEYLNGLKNDAEEDKQIFIPFQSWVFLKDDLYFNSCLQQNLVIMNFKRHLTCVYKLLKQENELENRD